MTRTGVFVNLSFEKKNRAADPFWRQTKKTTRLKGGGH